MTSGPGRQPRRRGITGRAIVLGAVVVMLVVVLAAPLHRYLAARSASSEARHQHDQYQSQLAQLQQESKQLDDPARIEQMARKRLQYALPGETVYVVVRAGEKPSTEANQAGDKSATKLSGETWHARLWGTVRAADASP